MSIDLTSIAPEVAQHLDALPEICRRHYVLRLDIYGSATRDDFDPGRSDVDFLVQFDPDAPPSDSWFPEFGLAEELAQVFGRKVDVLRDGSITNPYVLRRVEAARRQVFP